MFLLATHIVNRNLTCPELLKSMSQIFRYASQCAMYCKQPMHNSLLWLLLFSSYLEENLRLHHYQFQNRFIKSKWTFLLLYVICHMMYIIYIHTISNVCFFFRTDRNNDIMISWYNDTIIIINIMHHSSSSSSSSSSPAFLNRFSKSFEND